MHAFTGNSAVACTYADTDTQKFYLLYTADSTGYLGTFDATTEQVTTKKIDDFLPSGCNPRSVGVDGLGRYYFSVQIYGDGDYMYLFDANFKQLDRYKSKDPMYDFCGFDKKNGSFYFTAYASAGSGFGSIVYRTLRCGRVVYNAATDDYLIYMNQNTITEYSSDMKPLASYKTQHPVFAMYNYGDRVLVIEKDADSNYYVQLLDWRAPTTVTLSATQAKIAVGSSRALSVSDDASIGYTYTWTSSNTTVASVTKSGRVFGNLAGTATITAKAPTASLPAAKSQSMQTKKKLPVGSKTGAALLPTTFPPTIIPDGLPCSPLI